MKQVNYYFQSTVIFLLLLNFTSAFSQNVTPVLKSGKDIVINNQTHTTQEGVIDVPENWQTPGGRRLQLPIFIVKALNKTPAEPIFWFYGGPGSSNIRPTKRFTTGTPPKLLENHDFVCIGYRGVDGSTILKSKKVNKAMKGLNNKLLSEESLNNIENKIKEYQIKLQKEGINIDNYSMLDVIEDFEYTRNLLGYKKINTLSISYGTRIALLYSYKYPDVINRSVMIGANPPGHFVWFPEKTEQILDKYDSIYNSQTNANKKISIKEIMKTAFEKMPKKWSFFKLDVDKIKTGTFVALFSKDMAGVILEGYLKAVNYGDYSYLYLMQKLVDIGASDLIFGDLASKAISADYQEKVDYRTLLKGENTVLEGNLSMLYWGIASALKMKMIPEDFRMPKVVNTNTLVISGDLDVSTPSDYARDELMPYLKNGEQLLLKNMSHEDIIKRALNNPTLLSNYYDTGEINKSEMLKTEPINFKPSMKFSKTKIFIMGLIM